ncbi:MAG: sigma 54-interacting transcriptional regulator [Deltaproteobacteria bacterium]
MERRLEDIEETLPRRVSGVPVPTGRGSTVLYLAFFCDTPVEVPSRHHLDQLSVVTLGRGRTRQARRDTTAQSLELTLPDPWASTEHARLSRAGPVWRIEDCGSRNGVRINGRSVTAEQLADGDVIELGHTLLYYRQGASPAQGTGPDFTPADAELAGADFPTLSAELSSELVKAWDLAATDLPLLIQGESGTGKEVLARALSARSARPGPFVGVNCGAIPPSLVESELFGHVKGAFTGADSAHAGLIRSAHRGTLFLDEIGDLDLGAQAALLRVLQEREVRPVGSTRALPVDVRVLSATHRDLDALVAKGSFRADLLARLAGFRLRLPPLWQRREDIGLLISRLLAARRGEVAAELRFEPEAARRLFGYHWPLNIRELDNCLRAATVLARGGSIGEEHLPEQLRSAPDRRSSVPPAELTGADRDQRDQLVALFREHRGNVSAVARHLGKARTQVQRWLKRYQLDPRDYLE